MFEPVKVELWRDGAMFREFVAHRSDELKFRIELMTGVAWLDVREQYMVMMAMKLDRFAHPWQVCHSYEKWGGWQQEVAEIEVRMQRMTTEREDLRAEWYREWYLAETAYAGRIPRPPKIYWLGMALSAIWLLAYLLIYPSLPLVWAGTHWKGLGVPDGCQPWTAICEMQQGEAVLHEARGRYLDRVAEMPAAELAVDLEMREFIAHAARVRFADQCAACHGALGAGIPTAQDMAPVLTDVVWLHGGSVAEIQASIQSDKVHPFGLSRRMDEPTARMMAVYVHQLATGVAASVKED